MLSFLTRSKYCHLNKISIDQAALHRNYQALQNLCPQTKICPVLKSNAYGHGLKLTAQIFEKLDPPFLVVDSLYEAYELFKIGIKTPILIIGYTSPINFTVKKVPFHIAVFDLETARVLNSHQSNCSIHIFVDTGMNREGVVLAELPAFLDELKDLTNLKITGLCSHFSDADNSNNQDYTNLQIKNYEEAQSIMIQKGFKTQWRHISASGGMFRATGSDFNLVRAGLACYGINPLNDEDPDHSRIALNPALEFTTTLIQIKDIPAGSYVGYCRSYKTTKKTTLGILPAGYYDGVDRRLSNRGWVKIRNKFFPIVGKVSMNMTTIDISRLKEPKIGEQVTIYSAEKEDKNSIRNSAKIANTIPYDLLVRLAESTRREII